MMQRETTSLDGLIRLRPRIFTDARGRFLETFNARGFEANTGTSVTFVQDNESSSSKGVLRGLHFQMAPHAQGKLVHVVRGSVLDVCVDIRPNSETFGQHVKVRLDSITKEMLWIPVGFAHGFVALEDDTVFAYKCTGYYEPTAERTLRWNDPQLGIDWRVADPIISPKDAEGLTLEALKATLHA